MCFGMELLSGFQKAIDNFSALFRELGTTRIPLKMHILESHVVTFLERQEGFGYGGKGLGWWSEQASESVHSDWKKLWLGRKYVRAISHPDYDEQLLKCGVKYNSNHL